MTERWQEIALSLGTYEQQCGYEQQCSCLQRRKDQWGDYVLAEDACKRIADLETQVSDREAEIECRNWLRCRIAELEAEVARLHAEFSKPLGLEVVRTERKTEPDGGAS